MGDEMVIDGLSGFMLFEDEWGVLNFNVCGLDSGDTSCRDMFNSLEEF